jgi:hypothetical protein
MGEQEDQLFLFDNEELAGIAHPVTPGTLNPETGSYDPGQSPPGTGITDPGTGITDPGKGGGTPWAFDWAIGRGVTCVDSRQMTWRNDTLEGLVRSLPRGITLVGESTFHSYDLTKRQRVIQLAESRDINLLTVPARGNKRRREALGLPPDKKQSKQSDRDDALAIQYAATHGAHLKKPAIVEPEWEELREAARKRFILLRSSGGKDEYAISLMHRLPPYVLQPRERKVALGPKDSYNLVILAAVGVAAEFASNRRDFERLTGIYAHGYPSQFRSDFFFHGWKMRPEKQAQISLSVYRRELRWLFHQLKS